jgi:hypothetical protein
MAARLRLSFESAWRGRFTSVAPFAVGRYPWAWVAAVLPPVVALLWLIPAFVHRDLAADWQTYVRGTDAILAGRSPYAAWQLTGPYGLSDATNGAGYVYPPTAAVLLAPVIGSPEILAVANLAIYSAGLLTIAWRAGRLTPIVAAVILWSAEFHPGMLENLIVGNTSGILAGLLAWSPALGGAFLIGVAAALKLFPGVWALDPFLRRPARTIALVVAGFGAPALIALALAGIGPWLDYVAAMAHAGPSSGGRLTLAHLGLPAWSIYLLGLAIVAISLRVGQRWRLLGMGAAACAVAPDLPLSYSLLLSPGIVAVWLIRSGQKLP